MKIIIAPDKYKGNMTSPELCGIIRNEFLAEMPDAEIICIPLADGGDGDGFGPHKWILRGVFGSVRRGVQGSAQAG